METIKIESNLIGYKNQILRKQKKLKMAGNISNFIVALSISYSIFIPKSGSSLPGQYKVGRVNITTGEFVGSIGAAAGALLGFPISTYCLLKRRSLKKHAINRISKLETIIDPDKKEITQITVEGESSTVKTFDYDLLLDCKLIEEEDKRTDSLELLVGRYKTGLLGKKLRKYPIVIPYVDEPLAYLHKLKEPTKES